VTAIELLNTAAMSAGVHRARVLHCSVGASDVRRRDDGVLCAAASGAVDRWEAWS